MSEPNINSTFQRIGSLIQTGTAAGARLVRITAHESSNGYTARWIEFDAAGATQFFGDETFTVVNLAEDTDAGGDVPDNTDAIALDVEGRWVVFLRSAATATAAVNDESIPPLSPTSTFSKPFFCT